MQCTNHVSSFHLSDTKKHKHVLPLSFSLVWVCAKFSSCKSIASHSFVIHLNRNCSKTMSNWFSESRRRYLQMFCFLWLSGPALKVIQSDVMEHYRYQEILYVFKGTSFIILQSANGCHVLCWLFDNFFQLKTYMQSKVEKRWISLND